MSSRIKDLVDRLTPAEIKTLLNELFIAADAESLAAAAKIAWKDLIVSSVITDNTVDHLALTPKGFYDSEASESYKGVIQLAANSEVLAGTNPDKAVTPAALKHSVLLKEGNASYTPENDNDPATKKTVDDLGFKLHSYGYITSAGDINTGSSNFSSERRQEGIYRITHNLNTLQYQPIVYPELTPGGAIKTGLININNNYFDVRFADDASLNDSSFRFTILQYTNVPA